MKILIVEDEAMVARSLKRMITEILGSRLISLAHRETLLEGEVYLAENAIDLLLLDLNLNGSSGFDLLTNVTAKSFQTIIVSANSDQAIEAFEHGVVDFVPKPFTQERLTQALDRLGSSEVSNNSGHGKAQFLGVRLGGKTRLVPVVDILLIKGADKYSELQLMDGSVLLHEKNLRQLMVLLPSTFQRIHKSTIVDLVNIKDLISHRGSKYEARLKDGNCTPVGRSFVAELRARLG